MLSVPAMKAIDRRILQIAVPSIVSNITVPLLGLVDVAIVGHMGSDTYIGAIAVGSMIFSVVYWLFGFLRMGTSGLTSQALGRRDLDEVSCTLSRALAAALSGGAAVIVLQWPLLACAMALMEPAPELTCAVDRYFRVCVWGAPAVLAVHALNGWFLGMQNSRVPMVVSIVQNVANILASALLVYAAGMKIEGVALGTLTAQYVGLVASLALLVRHYGRHIRGRMNWRGIAEPAAMKSFVCVNRDIFLRTLCLVAVNFFFLSCGTSQGVLVLAANTLLMQFFTLFSYVMDGFAFSAEAICGRLRGAGDAEGLRAAVRRVFLWAVGLTVAYTAACSLGGTSFLSLLTDSENVVAEASAYLPWVVMVPVCGVAAFVWDGVYIGLTATRGMLLATSVAALCFAAVFIALFPVWGNHALWLSFLVFLSVRGMVQTAKARALLG